MTGLLWRARPQVGGMGDVVTALARAVQEEGHDVSVILPKYDIINYAEVRVPQALSASLFHTTIWLPTHPLPRCTLFRRVRQRAATAFMPL